MRSRKHWEDLLGEYFPRVKVTWMGHWPNTEMVLGRGENKIIISSEFMLPIAMGRIIDGLWSSGVCTWKEIKITGFSCHMENCTRHEIEWHDRQPVARPTWNKDVGE